MSYSFSSLCFLFLLFLHFINSFFPSLFSVCFPLFSFFTSLWSYLLISSAFLLSSAYLVSSAFLHSSAILSNAFSSSFSYLLCFSPLLGFSPLIFSCSLSPAALPCSHSLSSSACPFLFCLLFFSAPLLPSL